MSEKTLIDPAVDNALQRWGEGLFQMLQGGKFSQQETLQRLLENSLRIAEQSLCLKLGIESLDDFSLEEEVIEEDSLEEPLLTLQALRACEEDIANLEKRITLLQPHNLRAQIAELERQEQLCRDTLTQIWDSELKLADAQEELARRKAELSTVSDLDENGNRIIDTGRELLRARWECLKIVQEIFELQSQS
jgi:hypothetical protein